MTSESPCIHFDSEDAVALLAHEVRMMLKAHCPDVSVEGDRDVGLIQAPALTDTSSSSLSSSSPSDVQLCLRIAPAIVTPVTSRTWCKAIAMRWCMALSSDAISTSIATPAAVCCTKTDQVDHPKSVVVTHATAELASEIRRVLIYDVEKTAESPFQVRGKGVQQSLVKRGSQGGLAPPRTSDSQWVDPASQSRGAAQGARRRRRWCAGLLMPDGMPQIEVANARRELEEPQVSKLPFPRSRRRWRKSVLCPSLGKKSIQSYEPPQSGKKGLASSFKRLKRISERGLRPYFVPMRMSLVPQRSKERAALLSKRLRRIGEERLQPALEIAVEPHKGPRWPRSAAGPSQKVQVQGGSISQGSGNPPSIVGDAQLPGWSARLILYMGGGARTAKPLACASRYTAWNLLRDAVQLSAELRPIAQALACALAWGQREEGKFACVRDSATMLSVLTSFDISPCSLGRNLVIMPATAGLCAPLAQEESFASSGRSLVHKTRRQTKDCAKEALRDSKVHIERVRVHRVGCLLANLAQQVRSLSRRAIGPDSHASGVALRE